MAQENRTFLTVFLIYLFLVPQDRSKQYFCTLLHKEFIYPKKKSLSSSFSSSVHTTNRKPISYQIRPWRWTIRYIERGKQSVITSCILMTIVYFVPDTFFNFYSFILFFAIFIYYSILVNVF